MRKEEILVEGIFSGNERGFGFVEDIFIPLPYTNGALNGDTVAVKILSEQNGNRKREGKIIKIVKRETETVVGLFKLNKNFGFVIPDERKLGSDIFIPKTAFKGAKDNQKVVVKITKYPEKDRNAEGKVIEILGNVDEAGVDMLSLIREYELPYDFPKDVLHQIEDIKTTIDVDDIVNRVDLRDKEIFTIDGADAKDLDDAISVEKNEEGNYILNVHIADVSHYVKEGSNLDKEAYLRGTSIYMLDRVIPMLPQKLSNGICSLNQGEDRFTLAITAEIDKNGNIISNDIYKGVIRVTRRMTYDAVYQILQGNKEVIKEYKNYVSHFKLMEELANILKSKRDKEGQLNLDIPESKIILDKNGKAIDVKKYEITFANGIIEQFMLTANEVVAERFFWLTAPFVYRIHEVPDKEKVEELNKVLDSIGYQVKGIKEEIRPKSFAEILEKSKGTKEDVIVSTLLLRTLKLAKYSNENKGHFGLASKYYCHFTSPIRRYPDLFIHRVISKYIKSQYNVDEKTIEKYKNISAECAEQSSNRERLAKEVEREADDIKKAEYMETKIGEIYEGVISSVTGFGVFVKLENTVEGLIKFDDLGDDFYIYSEEHKYLIGERTKEIFKIGDPIKIEVISASKTMRTVDFRRLNED